MGRFEIGKGFIFCGPYGEIGKGIGAKGPRKIYFDLLTFGDAGAN